MERPNKNIRNIKGLSAERWKELNTKGLSLERWIYISNYLNIFSSFKKVRSSGFRLTFWQK